MIHSLDELVDHHTDPIEKYMDSNIKYKYRYTHNVDTKIGGKENYHPATRGGTHLINYYRTIITALLKVDL